MYVKSNDPAPHWLSKTPREQCLRPHTWPSGRMLALYVVVQGSVPSRFVPNSCCRMVVVISPLSFQHYGKPSSVAFIVLAQLCGPRANETEMGVVLFNQMARQGAVIISLPKSDNDNKCLS